VLQSDLAKGNHGKFMALFSTKKMVEKKWDVKIVQSCWWFFQNCEKHVGGKMDEYGKIHQ